jgi:hypothetical protein
MIPTASPAEPQVEYASALTSAADRVVDIIDPAGVRRAMILLLVGALLSGGCVAVCFLTLSYFESIRYSGGAEALAAFIFHAMVYISTIAVHVVANLILQRSTKFAETPGEMKTRIGLDVAASIALLLIGVWPLLMVWSNRSSGLSDFDFWLVVPMVCFGVLGLSAYRLRMTYIRLASIAATAGRRGLRTGLRFLGWTKFLVEMVWLMLFPLAGITAYFEISDLSIPLLIGFALGCGVYGIILILMLVFHSMLIGLRFGRTGGFEVRLATPA